MQERAGANKGQILDQDNDEGGHEESMSAHKLNKTDLSWSAIFEHYITSKTFNRPNKFITREQYAQL